MRQALTLALEAATTTQANAMDINFATPELDALIPILRAALAEAPVTEDVKVFDPYVDKGGQWWAALRSEDAPSEQPEPVAWIERKVYRRSEDWMSYIRARLQDNQSKTDMSFQWKEHRWRYEHSSFDDTGDYDLIARPTPPAAPSEQKDAARLDWLDHVRPTIDYLGLGYTVRLTTLTSGNQHTGSTFRAAIDAAMKGTT